MRIEASVSLLRPIAKARPLIIDKEATIPNTRLLTASLDGFIQNHGFTNLYRNVSPVDPWIYSKFLRQMEQAVNGATLVASADDQAGAFHGCPKLGGIEHFDFVDFTKSVHSLKMPLFLQLLRKLTRPQCQNNDAGAVKFRNVLRLRRLLCHTPDVPAYRLYNSLNTKKGGLLQKEIRLYRLIRQCKIHRFVLSFSRLIYDLH